LGLRYQAPVIINLLQYAMKINSIFSLFTLLVFLFACSDKEEEVYTESVPFPMTLIVNDNFLNLEDSVYYMISTADGAFLAGKWQCGPGSVVFEPPSGVHWPDSVTLTIVQYSLSLARVPYITSFYSLPGGTFNLSGGYDFSSGHARVNLINRPSLQPGSIGIISAGVSSRIFRPAEGCQFDVPSVPSSDKFYVKIEKESGQGFYKMVSVAPQTGNYDIDLQETTPLQEIALTADPALTLFSARISGSFETEPISVPLYLLDYNPHLELNSVVWYPSGGLFTTFFTSVSCYNASDEATLSSETLGVIPSVFTGIDGTFSFESTEWPVLSWQTTADFDMSFAEWQYDFTASQGILSYRVYWKIYGPGSSSRYKMPEIPLAVEAIVNLDKSRFTQASVSLSRFGNQATYYSWLRNILFKTYSERKLLESKTISKGFGLKKGEDVFVFSPSFPEGMN